MLNKILGTHKKSRIPRISWEINYNKIFFFKEAGGWDQNTVFELFLRIVWNQFPSSVINQTQNLFPKSNMQNPLLADSNFNKYFQRIGINSKSEFVRTKRYSSTNGHNNLQKIHFSFTKSQNTVIFSIPFFIHKYS